MASDTFINEMWLVNIGSVGIYISYGSNLRMKVHWNRLNKTKFAEL